VTKSIIEDDGRVKEFIVKQTEPTSFTVVYVSEMALPREKLEEIRKAMATYLEEGLQITFEHVTTLNRSKRGKLKQFESLLERS
jgi:phenylacetate-CoA ligase